jgi:hypothetical protein
MDRIPASERTVRLRVEYEAFASRDLSAFVFVYLFVAGIAEVVPISSNSAS